MLKKSILILAATFAAGLLFVNIYNSVVDAPNWGRDIPASLNAARSYFVVANPGTFYRFVSPINQVLTLLALIVCWREGKKMRMLIAVALLFAVAADVMTFGFFYPRNEIMFVAPLDPNVEALRSTWSQWSTMNWVRSAICGVVVIFDYLALITVAKTDQA